MTMNMLARLAAFSLLLVSLVSARPLGPIDLRVAAAQADFIVTGEMREGFALESKQSLHVEGNVHILQTITGTIPRGAVLTLSWDSRPLWEREKPTRYPVTTQLALWFIKKLPAGGYAGLPVHPGSPYWEDSFLRWPAICPAPLLSNDMDASEKVTRAIGHAIECMATWPGIDMKPGVRMQGSVVSSFMNEQQAVFWNLAEAFRSMRLPAREKLDQSFAHSSSPHLQVIGLADLIDQQRPEAVVEAGRALDSLLTNTWIAPLCPAIMSYDNDSSPAAVRALGSMATQHDGPITKSAVYALRIIHTREAMPYLVALLDSPDREVVSHALFGISSFILNLPADTPQWRNRIVTSVPCPRPRWITEETEPNCWRGGFIGKPHASELKDFWKAWWGRHGAEVMRSQPEPRDQNASCQPYYPHSSTRAK